jgi:hypothetical protein
MASNVNGTPWFVLGLVLFLWSTGALLLLQLVSDVWRNRSSVRPNLQRASAAVLTVIAGYSLEVWWSGTPIRPEAPIAVSIIVFSVILVQRLYTKPRS